VPEEVGADLGLPGTGLHSDLAVRAQDDRRAVLPAVFPRENPQVVEPPQRHHGEAEAPRKLVQLHSVADDRVRRVAEGESRAWVDAGEIAENSAAEPHGAQVGRLDPHPYPGQVPLGGAKDGQVGA
jgi:hypothetical protein